MKLHKAKSTSIAFVMVSIFNVVQVQNNAEVADSINWKMHLEAIATIDLAFNPSTNGMSAPVNINLEGCGCNPTVD